MNINFLNNQNYIFGKKEKNKLLIKFFLEKIIKIFFSFLKKLDNFSFIWKYYLVILLTGIVILLTGIVIFLSIGGKSALFVFIIGSFFYLIFLGGIYSIYKGEIDLKIKKYGKQSVEKKKGFKSLFIGHKFLGFNNLVLYFLFLTFLSKIVNNNFNDDIVNWFIIGFMLFFLFFYLISYVNIFNIFVFIIFIFSQFFYIIYLFFYIIIVKLKKGYKFLKFFPQSKLLKKFNFLYKNSAENNFYKIILKK